MSNLDTPAEAPAQGEVGRLYDADWNHPKKACR
jgi:hypothetical protein